MKRTPKSMPLYFSLLLIVICLLIYLYTEIKPGHQQVALRTIIALTLFNFVFLMVNLKQGRKAMANLLLENQRFSQVKDEIIHFRQYRHDIKNHLIVMYELAHQGKENELITYAKDLIGDTDRALIECQTGSNAIDVLIYNKLQAARANGITFTLSVDHVLTLNPKATLAMVSILSNLLDNAIEATTQIEVTAERFISLTLTSDPLHYKVIITNSFSPHHPIHPDQVFKKGYTSQAKKDNQGLGLSIVKKTVDAIGGNLHLNIYNGVFFQLSFFVPKHRVK